MIPLRIQGRQMPGSQALDFIPGYLYGFFMREHRRILGQGLFYPALLINRLRRYQRNLCAEDR